MDLRALTSTENHQPHTADFSQDAALTSHPCSKQGTQLNLDAFAPAEPTAPLDGEQVASVIRRIKVLKHRAAAATATASAATAEAHALRAQLEETSTELARVRACASALTSERDTLADDLRESRDALALALSQAQALRSERASAFEVTFASVKEQFEQTAQDLDAERALGAQAAAAIAEQAKLERVELAKVVARRAAEERLLQIELCEGENELAALRHALLPREPADDEESVVGSECGQAVGGGAFDSVLLEGWCLKRSRWLRAWRPRWIVLVSEDGGRTHSLLTLKAPPRADGGEASSLGASATERMPIDQLVTLASVALAPAELALVVDGFSMGGGAVRIEHPAHGAIILATPSADETRSWTRALAAASAAPQPAPSRPRGATGQDGAAEWLCGGSLFGSPAPLLPRVAQFPSTPASARGVLAKTSVQGKGVVLSAQVPTSASSSHPETHNFAPISPLNLLLS